MHGTTRISGWKTRGRGLAMAAALALGATLAQGTALAQDAQQAQAGQKAARSPHSAAAMAEAMDKMAKFKHARLTEDKAKAAMEVFLKMRETYPPETFRSKKPGPNGPVDAMKKSERAKEILALVKKKGFADIDDWAQTFSSLGLAIAHVRQGSDEDIQAKLRDLEQASLPERMKARIRAMLKAMIPPQENVKVAQRLLADEEAKKLIEAVERTARGPAKK